jgi:hypothetical protein
MRIPGLKNDSESAYLLDRVSIDRSTSCWNWAGTIEWKGYGRACISGKRGAAHRVMWAAFYGPIPETMCVLHRCDNPRCVNPTHLFLGTVDDNNKDKKAKGRATFGERSGSTILTECDARKIIDMVRAGEISQRKIGAMFGICHSAVSQIASGKNWAHLQRESRQP